MAAVAYAFTSPLGFVGSNPQLQVIYFITDPALQGDGSGHDARQLALVVSLDPTDPFGWDAAIENAVIADAAAQPQPFTVSAFRCLTPVYSDSLLKDSINRQVVTDGFVQNMPSNLKSLILDPAGTLASGTVNLPGSPSKGRIAKISSTQTITALTINPGTNAMAPNSAITTIAAGGHVEYTFNLSNNTWYRTG